MNVTEIQFRPVKQRDSLVGYASVVLDGCYYLSSIAVHTKQAGGYRLLYPAKQVGERMLNVHHPLNKETSKALEDAILRKVETIFDQADSSYGNQWKPP